MNSDMSRRTMASSLSKRKRASWRASSVLPTPVGPRKMNDPIGRRASLRPARARRTAWEMTLTASSWPIRRAWMSSSIRSRRVDSSSTRRETGTPVQELTISAMFSSSTSGTVAPSLSRHSISSLTYLSLSFFSLSRKQGGVLLDVLAVLVEGRGADALDLTAGQGGLENVGGVDGPLGGACADQGVELIDEEDHLATGANLIKDLLQALLEFTAILGTGDQRPHVERQHPLAAQRLRDVAEHDLLRQA